jgi:hypothetical protein
MFWTSRGVVKSTLSTQMAIVSGSESPRRVDLINKETSPAYDPAIGGTPMQVRDGKEPSGRTAARSAVAA